MELFSALVSMVYKEVDRIHIKMGNLLYKIQNSAVKFNSSLVMCQVSWKPIKSIKLRNLDILKDIILFNIETVLQKP